MPRSPIVDDEAGDDRGRRTPSPFGDRLREARLARSLTQAELAERAGISTRSVSDLERGLTRTPYRDTVHRLADVLDLQGNERTDFESAARRGPAPAPVEPRMIDIRDEHRAPRPAGWRRQAAGAYRIAASRFSWDRRTRAVGLVTAAVIAALATILSGATRAPHVTGDTLQFETAWTVPPAPHSRPENLVSLAVAPDGDIYALDRGMERVSRFSSHGQLMGSWGTPGTDIGAFREAQGLTIDTHGSVYVADGGNNRVQVFTAIGRPLAHWGTAGRGTEQLSNPTSVAVDAEGYSYVADQGNARIQVFAAGGKPVARWTRGGWDSEPLAAPDSVAVDGHGTVWAASADGDSVQSFSADGTRLSIWDTTDFFHHSLVSPTALGLDGARNVYVLDSAGTRIQEFSPSGERIAVWRAPWGIPGFGHAVARGALAITPRGDLYVGSARTGVIARIAGHKTEIVATPASAPRPTASTPQDVAVDPFGGIHVLDAANGRILVLDGSGRLQRIQEIVEMGSGSRARSLGGIAVDGQDNTYVTDYGGGHIVRLANNGAVQYPWESVAPQTPLVMPRGIALDRHGNVLVTDQSDAYVEKFSSTGRFERLWRLPTTSSMQPYPAGVTVDARDGVFVTDPLAGRVAHFAEQGDLAAWWNGSRTPTLHAPLAIAASPSGNTIYVADSGAGAVQEWTSSGRLLRVARLPQFPSDRAPAPSGLAVDTRANVLYVADPGNRKIDAYHL